MTLKLISSGKSAVLSGKIDADLFIDCRGMVNPFRDKALIGGGPDAIDHWMETNNSSYIEAAATMIATALETAPTRNSFKILDKTQEPKPLTVCFFCLAGQHRSPAMKRAIAKVVEGWGDLAPEKVIVA